MNAFEKHDIMKKLAEIHNNTDGLNLTDCRALLRVMDIINNKVNSKNK